MSQKKISLLLARLRSGSQMDMSGIVANECMKKIEICPHDPRWRDGFETEAKNIARALGSNLIAVHHIGSTSIPGIFAKPIIDMLVDVKDINDVDNHNSTMESLGYEVMGEFGIDGRRYFRKDNDAGVRTHHVHIFENGSPHIARHLAFRDYMIANPDQAHAYSELKQRLAGEHAENPEEYMDGKDEFIKEIDRRAARWRS
jgi:GrpB-like predicted nucleotidyltransferase (UPF0157 family)